MTRWWKTKVSICTIFYEWVHLDPTTSMKFESDNVYEGLTETNKYFTSRNCDLSEKRYNNKNKILKSFTSTNQL